MLDWIKGILAGKPGFETHLRWLRDDLSEYNQARIKIAREQRELGEKSLKLLEDQNRLLASINTNLVRVGERLDRWK